MKNLLLCAALVCVTDLAVAANSLCESKEQTIFNCILQGSSKLVSICGSYTLTSDTGYLQYRYGRTGNIELEFPKDKINSQKMFKFAHYFRFQLDRTEVVFENNGYQYAVYSYYDGEEKPAKTENGIRVINPSGNSKDLICSARPTNQLAVLESVVPCDKDNPLTMGCE